MMPSVARHREVLDEQLDLFAAASTPPQYVGWKPDPVSAPAYEAEWDLWNKGKLRPDQSVWARLFLDRR